jgi:hypothetical protein
VGSPTDEGITVRDVTSPTQAPYGNVKPVPLPDKHISVLDWQPWLTTLQVSMHRTVRQDFDSLWLLLFCLRYLSNTCIGLKNPNYTKENTM